MLEPRLLFKLKFRIIQVQIFTAAYLRVPFFSQVIKISFLIVCISFLAPPCLCVRAYAGISECARVHGHSCVRYSYSPILPPCHSVLLCPFFNFSNFCSDSQPTHVHAETQTDAHTPISSNHYLTEWNTSTIRHTLSQRHICDWDSGKWKENPCYITWVSQSRAVVGHRGRVVVCAFVYCVNVWSCVGLPVCVFV